MKKLKPDSILRRDDNDKRRVFLINVAKKAFCVSALLSCLACARPLFSLKLVNSRRFILFTCRSRALESRVIHVLRLRFAQQKKAAWNYSTRMRKRSAFFNDKFPLELKIIKKKSKLSNFSSVTSQWVSCKIACCCNRTKWQWNRKALAIIIETLCKSKSNSSFSRDFLIKIDIFWISNKIL